MNGTGPCDLRSPCLISLLNRSVLGFYTDAGNTAGTVDDAYHHELVRHARRQADDGDHPARLADFGRIDLAVALDEEGFRRGPALQGAGPEKPFKVRRKLARDAVPQLRVVGLESGIGEVELHPAGGSQEQPPHADVGPSGLA